MFRQSFYESEACNHFEREPLPQDLTLEWLDRFLLERQWLNYLQQAQPLLELTPLLCRKPYPIRGTA